MQAPAIRIHPHIDEIPPRQWDALAAGQPVLRHAFLQALEHSGCVGPGTGWQPRHAALWAGGELLAAMPLYLKAHSYGEYVFDWAWAEAYQRNGLAYYPKWLAAVPFTPVPGPRLLGTDGAARQALLDGVLAMVEESGGSSFHLLFPTDEEADWLQARGLMLRTGVQFHWRNRGYGDFEAFLASLSRDKRKKIRQERRRVADAGVSFRVLHGAEAGEADWDFFYRCYALTYAQHRSSPYLNRAFFGQLGRALGPGVVLCLAEAAGRPVAASLCLRDEEALYGRYWGAVEEIPCLHFEACYYQPIDYAIRAGLARFEGGAQGEHKLARGLEPVRTVSAHWLRDGRFADAVARYLARETPGVAAYLDELSERSPFR